jgi:hypothetical protein
VSALPSLGSAVPRRGNRPLVLLGRGVLAVLRWRVEGDVPNLPKFVVAVAPHTSNWDFVIGAAAMFALDLHLAFIGKHTLFRPPFGAVLRWMGGIPVDRSTHHGLVDDSVAAFSRMERRVLAIAPQPGVEVQDRLPAHRPRRRRAGDARLPRLRGALRAAGTDHHPGPGPGSGAGAPRSAFRRRARAPRALSWCRHAPGCSSLIVRDFLTY